MYVKTTYVFFVIKFQLHAFSQFFNGCLVAIKLRKQIKKIKIHVIIVPKKNTCHHILLNFILLNRTTCSNKK